MVLFNFKLLSLENEKDVCYKLLMNFIPFLTLSKRSPVCTSKIATNFGVRG